LTQAPPQFVSLSAAELDGVAEHWRRERREFLAAFNGTSMLPTIAPGQPVVVECGRDPLVGDVAVFRFNNQVGVHRVVARTDTWLMTWGDANPLPDEPFAAAGVIGVIRDVAPAPHSSRRRLLLRLLTTPQRPVELLTQRIRLAYRIRSVWGQGILVFATTAVRALLRRLSPN
jgi:hypothetical protein